MRPTNLSSLVRLPPHTAPSAASQPQSSQPSPIVTFAGSRGAQMRIVALEEDTVRVQVWPDGKSRLDRSWMIASVNSPREGRLRDDLSSFSCPALKEEPAADGTSVHLSTAKLSVEVRLRDGRLCWFNDKNVAFARDLSERAYCYDIAGRMVSHYLEREEEHKYYGFGEKSGYLDKHGRRLKMYNLDALGYNAETSDPLYKHWPIYITFVPSSGSAYALIYDNLATCIFDLGQEHDNYYHAYRYWQAEDGDVDYTLVYGPTIPEVIRKISKLIGLPALLPRWAFGYLGSTMSYTDAPNAQERLREFVDLCNTHSIPCDLFHLSSGYSMSDEGKRYVFVWNKKRVPDPNAMVAHFHSAGIHLAANIKPCLLLTHPAYNHLASVGAFVRSADSDAPQTNIFWGGTGSHLDFTNPVSYDWWKSQVREHILGVGIDSTWNDNNEFSIPDSAARCVNFGNEVIPVGLLRPVHTLLMTRASYEAQCEQRKDLRPYLITRAGCPGIQRYAQTWSGDNKSNWHSLKFNTPMGLGMSLSGAPNVGHDVGGFAGKKPDPELWIRDGSVNEPWMYPDVLLIVRSIMRLRYRLIPYLYNLHVHSTRTGDPIIRPMVYHFPHDARCHTESFDYMLGPHLLVACVFEDGARKRDVSLPSGTRWFNFYTGVSYSGGSVVSIDAPLESVPLLVREGGIIPMAGEDVKHVGEKRVPFEVVVFPPTEGSASYSWVDDDGVSVHSAETEFTLEVIALSAHLQLRLQQTGNYAPLHSAIRVVLPRPEARPIKESQGVVSEAQRDDGARVVTIRS